MSGKGDFKLVTIEIETVFGKDQRMDEMFTSYLNEYSIDHKISETEDPTSTGWPKLQYTGGPISLTNMLQEKFGYSIEEIQREFPQITEALGL